jgi:hypothetical protein
MSAGEFVIANYDSSEVGFAMPVRVQPETLLLFVNGIANASSPTPVGIGLFAQVTKNRNAYGVGCRNVTVRWTGAPPAGYKAGEALRIPVMTEAAYATYVPGSTGTYLGSPVVIVSRTNEVAR